MTSKKMFPLHMSTVLLVLAFSVSETFEQRIIGGQEVPAYSIKYQASLLSSRGHYCGGTLVHPQWVVSAAHCWRPKSMMWVALSEHNLAKVEGFEKYFSVSRIYVYHGFTSYNYNNDIMLIKLHKPAQLDHHVQPVPLPDGNTPALTGQTSCTVSGWGVIRRYSYYISPVLRAVNVDISPSCGYYPPSMISSSMLCAGSRISYKDACQGDSGGPLVCNGNLEGIVSWGISCAHPLFPGVYTSIRRFVPWINYVISHH